MKENKFQKTRYVINIITALVWFFTPLIFIFCLVCSDDTPYRLKGADSFAVEHPIQSTLCYVGIFGAPALFIIMTTLFVVMAIIDYVKKRRAKKQIQAKE
ncbi:MAG: hypothetical protein IKP78_10625 [Ruminococcus sp.]|nr:hypothetical protein [Ruminococcus sp.]